MRRYRKRVSAKPKRYRKKITKSAPNRKLAKMVRSVVRSTLEPRHFRQYSNNVSNVVHRDLYYMTPFSTIASGTGESQRAGTTIYIKGIYLKLMPNRKSTFFDDIRLRICAFWQPRNEVDTSETANATWATATVVRDALYENEGSGLEIVNRQFLGIKPVYDRNIILKSNNYGSVSSAVTKSARPINIYIPCNFNFSWRSPFSGASATPIKQFFITFYAYGGGLAAGDLNTLFDLSSSYVVYFRDV